MKYELDSTMLKKLETLNRQCLILNTMESEIKASYQISHSRIIIVVQRHYDFMESFPLYTYQRQFINLTYADLEEAIAEMTYYQKYDSK